MGDGNKGCASSCGGGDSVVLLDDLWSDGELGVDCSLLFDMLSDSNVVLLTKALNRLTAPTLVILSPLMSSSFSEWLGTSPGAICCQVSEAVVSYLEVLKRKLMLVYNISRRSSINAYNTILSTSMVNAL